MTFDDKLDEYMRAIYDCGYVAGEAGLTDKEALPEVMEVAKEAIRELVETEIFEAYKKGGIDGGIAMLKIRRGE